MSTPEKELEKLNHELRNAIVVIEGIMKKMNKAVQAYEASLKDE